MATPLEQIVFWARILGALAIAAVSVAILVLAPRLDLSPGGVEAGEMALLVLSRGVPAGGILLAIWTTGFVGQGWQWLGIGGLVIVNLSLLAFLGSLLYQWATR